jgi:predicted MFS family arabinose efflux permease
MDQEKMMASNAEAATHGTGQAFGTPGYRSYVIFSLTALYTLNFIDRILIGVVGQPIIEEFGLKDWQFGLLSGFGFALFYTLVGIPIARLAERYSRVKIITVGVILWSIMTALCGFAWGFASLLIFRIGVGVGEACLTPPANSMIADYYPPKSRAKALGIYAMGISIGGLLANLFGGPLTQAFSWQMAFIVLGLPGVVMGLIFYWTVKEPPRGYSDPSGASKLEPMSILQTIKEVGSKPTFWLNAAAASLVAFVGYGFISFQTPYFMRTYGLSIAEVAVQIATPLAIASSLGAFAGGWLTEKLSDRYPTCLAWIPALGLSIGIPLYWAGLMAGTPGMATIILFGALCAHSTYLGAQYTLCQGVASPRSRATAIALLLFIVNLVGYGCGPLFIGILSDQLMAAQLAASSYSGELTTALCAGSAEALVANLGAAKAAACAEASAQGLGGALRWSTALFGVAAIFFLLASRTMLRDFATPAKAATA